MRAGRWDGHPGVRQLTRPQRLHSQFGQLGGVVGGVPGLYYRVLHPQQRFMAHRPTPTNSPTITPVVSAIYGLVGESPANSPTNSPTKPHRASPTNSPTRFRSNCQATNSLSCSVLIGAAGTASTGFGRFCGSLLRAWAAAN